MSGYDTTSWADYWPRRCPGQFFPDRRDRCTKHLVWLGEAQPLKEAKGHQAEGGMVAETSP